MTWPIFPVKLIWRDGRWRKIPLINEWRSRASSAPTQIAAWRKEFPDAVFGIELGRAGLIVVDADRHGGPDGVTALADLGPLPPHPIVQTPSGGEHHYFRQPYPPIAGKLAWRPGIDLLGVGRFVVAYGEISDPIPVLPGVFRVEAKPPNGAPSSPYTANPDARIRSIARVVLNDPSKRSLYWAACRYSEMIEQGCLSRECATKLLRVVASHRRLDQSMIADGLSIVDRRIDGLLSILATAPKGERNNTLYWVAIELSQLTPRYEELLIEAAMECGLRLDEIRLTIASAVRRGDQWVGGST